MNINQINTIDDLRNLINSQHNLQEENNIFIFYDEIKNVRNTKNWNNLFNICVEKLNIVKDIYIACWLLESLTYEKKLLGFYIGINLISILINEYENIFPIDMELKFNAFDWVNNHLLEWLESDIILQDNGTFAILYLEIYSNQFNKEILKKYKYSNEFTSEKILLINNIQNIIQNMQLFNSSFSNLINYCYKIKIFYENCNNFLQNTLSQDKNIETSILFNNKNDIINEIHKLSLEGLKSDKNDIILYLIYKICLLNKKPLQEIITLIRENQLSNLID